MKDKIKYIMHPGFIMSKNDNDEHFISGKRLIQLYGLNPKECFIASFHYKEKLKFISFDNTSYKHLYPRYDGNYNIKK